MTKLKHSRIPERDDINFVIYKIAFLRSVIERDYELVSEDISRKTFARHIQHLQIFKSQLKNYGEISFESDIPSINFEIPLFFYLDSFIVDVKRCIEFILRNLKKEMGFKDTDFSLSKFIEQLDPKYEQIGKEKRTKSRFMTKLQKEQPWFTSFMLSESKWLKEVNENRNDVSHYRVLNKTSKCKTKRIWKSKNICEEPSTIELPKLMINDYCIKDLVSEWHIKLDEFVKNAKRLHEIITSKNKITEK